MPNFGIPQAGSFGPPNAGLNVTELQPGDFYYLFNAESPTAPQASVAIATGYCPGGGLGAALMFTADWATSPTAEIDIQGSNTLLDADFILVGSIVNQQHGYYADGGGFRFYRAYLASQSAGGAVTVIVKRG